jgi:acyl-CoA thioesterase-2
MTQAVVHELIELLRLERLEDNLFRGQSRDIGTRYVFGGQVLGQALSAAQQTVDAARLAHSMHAYFLRAGDNERPIIYNVERTRDGGSFSVRRITAIQHGQPIFVSTVSFQIQEDGASHQVAMPEVPRPEDLSPPEPLSEEALANVPVKLRRWLMRLGPFEFRHVWPRDEINPPKRPPLQHVWFRLGGQVDDDPVLHRSLLAYLHPNVQMASLDHAIWFHRPFRADEWLLYSCDSPSAQGARGLARGSIYTRDGILVASTAQEGLIRLVNPDARRNPR